MKAGLNRYFEELLLRPSAKDRLKINGNTRSRNNKLTLSQYFEKELLEETTAAERLPQIAEKSDSFDEETNNNHDEEEIDIYTSYASYMSSSDPGSDNLLVTFDYGFQDSLEADVSLNYLQHLDDNAADDNNFKHNLCKIAEEKSSEDLNAEIYTKSPNIFKVHQAKHVESNSGNINTRSSSCLSLQTSLVEYNIDTSGDYGSWAQSESEPEEGNDNEKSYRYEDLIKNEVLIYDDDDGNDDDGKEVIINFNFNDDTPPRWFNNNEQLYYRSVDYLN